MAVTERYRLYNVVVDDTADTVLGGIGSQSGRVENTILRETDSGQVYNRFNALVGQELSFDFSTRDVSDALDASGLEGAKISSYASGLAFYLAKEDQEGVGAASGSVHRKCLFTKGIWLPTGLTADHQQNAEIQYAVHPLDDGGTVITVSDNNALPTADNETDRFALGPVTLESTSYDHFTSIQMAFGQEVTRVSADSDLTSSFASIERALAAITFRGINPKHLFGSAIGLGGLACTHANTTLYLKKRSASGFVANGTTQHIKFTAAGNCYPVDIFSSDGNSPSQTAFTMFCSFDGTNLPIAITTGSAIT